MPAQDWSPRAPEIWPYRIEPLEKLARTMVGDGKHPNLFFVTVDANVVMISQDFAEAYRVWGEVSEDEDRPTALEDRQTGVLASIDQSEEDPEVFERRDDSAMLLSR